MKTQRPCLLVFVLIFCVETCFAQTTLFRSPDASFEKYQSLIAGSTFRITPMDQLEKRLDQDELPSFLQHELDQTLQNVAQSPEKANEQFESFYSKLEAEPRSTAIRETMMMVLERIQPGASIESQLGLQKKMEVLRKSNKPSHDLRLQSSLVQKEILEKIQWLKRLPGGQDLTIFWNGLRWNENLPVEADQSSQWIFLSSQWRARILTGTWTDVAGQIQNGFQDWVTGSCAEPRYSDLLVVGSAQREALYSSDCLANGETSKSQISQPSLEKIETPPLSLKPWIIGAAVVGVGLMLLSLSGKKIQIQR